MAGWYVKVEVSQSKVNAPWPATQPPPDLTPLYVLGNAVPNRWGYPFFGPEMFHSLVVDYTVYGYRIVENARVPDLEFLVYSFSVDDVKWSDSNIVPSYATKKGEKLEWDTVWVHPEDPEQNRDKYHSIDSYRWLYIPSFDTAKFTSESDIVDFNAIAASGTAWEGNPYDALDGDDVVTLPSEANALKIKDKDDSPVFEIAGLHFHAGAGNDKVDGRQISGHKISISGGHGDDRIWGGQRSDVLLGESGSDTIRGGPGDDRINGNDEGDHLYGDGDNDSLYGGDGADFLYGGAGEDNLFGADILPSDGSDADYMDGGTGTDTFYAADGDIIKNLELGERIYLTSFADVANLIVIRQNDGTYVQLLDPITASQTVKIEERIRADSVRIGEDTKGLLYIERVSKPSNSAFQDPIGFWEAFSKNMGAAIDEKRTPELAKLFGNLAKDSHEFAVSKAWEYCAKRFPSEFAKATPHALVFDLTVVAFETWKVAGKAWSGEYRDSSELTRALFGALSSFVPFKDSLVNVGQIGAQLGAVFIDSIVKSFIEVQVSQIVEFFRPFTDATDGPDIQVGDGNSNFFYPGEGSDTVRSGAGDDYVQGGSGGGDDLYDLGSGFDTVGYQSAKLGITVDLEAGTASGREIDNDTLVSVEEVIGGQGADTIRGDRFANVLRGGEGADRMFGLSGNDRVYGDSGSDRLYGNDGNDRLYGGDSNDWLYGGGGRDLMVGGNGNDFLNGGSGDDDLRGGPGNDVYVTDSVRDKVVETARQGIDRVESFVSHRLAANVENLILLGKADLRGIGNAAENVIRGNAGANALSGLDGNDFLIGYGGNDRLGGGNGNDRIMGNGGADVLVGGTGADFFVFRLPSDSTLGAMDMIAGFDGAGRRSGDRIDLHLIDAVAGKAGNQAFAFGDSHAKGHLWAKDAQGGDTIICGNIDNDSFAEIQICIRDGSRISADDYFSGDFIL